MHGHNYAEEQMTPWYRLAQQPGRPGRYQLKSVNSQAIHDGWYEQGRWQIGFKGSYSPLALASSNFEWRGLRSFNPVPACPTQHKPMPYGLLIEW